MSTRDANRAEERADALAAAAPADLLAQGRTRPGQHAYLLAAAAIAEAQGMLHRRRGRTASAEYCASLLDLAQDLDAAELRRYADAAEARARSTAATVLASPIGTAEQRAERKSRALLAVVRLDAARTIIDRAEARRRSTLDRGALEALALRADLAEVLEPADARECGALLLGAYGRSGLADSMGAPLRAILEGRRAEATA